MTRSLSPQVVRTRDFQQWLRTWWAEDFSISGCAEKGIEPPRAARGTSVEFGGRTWFSSHCPPCDLDGLECEDFSRLPRLTSDVYRESSRYSPELDIDLRGAFIDDFVVPNLSSAKIRMDYSYIGSLKLREGFSGQVTLSARSAFINKLSCTNTGISDIEISGSIVTGPSSINCGRQSKTSAGKTQFLGEVSFAGMFSSLNLSGSKFHHELNMNAIKGVSLLDISHCTFFKPFSISGKSAPQAGKLNLGSSKFNKGASFNALVSSHPIDLSRSRVKGELKFSYIQAAKIDMTNIKAGNTRIDASDCELYINGGSYGNLHIGGGKYPNIFAESISTSGYLLIEEALVSGQVALGGATVGGRLIFRECETALGIFAKGLKVGQGAMFRGSTLGHSASFRSATFSDGADFNARSDRVETTRAPSNDIGAIDFRSAHFGSRKGATAADFSGRVFKGKADFQHASFGGVAYFERDAFKEDVSFRLAKFAHPKSKIFSFSLSASRPYIIVEPPTSMNNDNENAHLFERAFSNLKDCMKGAGSSRFEKKFHIYELRARRARYDHEVGISERSFSYLYDIFSEYGESISRPLTWLFAIPLLFGVLYYIIGGSLRPEDIWPSLEFSLQQIFRPFYIWGVSPHVESARSDFQEWQYLYLFDADETHFDAHGRSVAIKLLAVLESVGAITLSFLLALSIKRRFQVQ